jgi:hypothetical protein
MSIVSTFWESNVVRESLLNLDKRYARRGVTKLCLGISGKKNSR